MRKYDFFKGLDDKTGYGFFLSKKGFCGNRSSADKIRNSKYITDHVYCISNYCISLSTQSSTPLCINIEDSIYPKDIWDINDEFGQVTRNVFYGCPEIKEAKPNYDSLIPDIAQMVWLGGGVDGFLFYLSVLSLLHVAEVEKQTLYDSLYH